jgi:hypothetical protein
LGGCTLIFAAARRITLKVPDQVHAHRALELRERVRAFLADHAITARRRPRS